MNYKKRMTKIKIYSIIKKSSMWSTNSLIREVEQILNEKNREGYEVVSVAFGINLWALPTAYITLSKQE